MNRALVIKATAGLDDPPRCNTAFTAAIAAAASATTVSLWLAGEASMVARPEYAQRLLLPDSMLAADKLAAVLASSKVTVCATCAARRSITPGMVSAGIRVASPAVYVEECLMPGALNMVF